MRSAVGVERYEERSVDVMIWLIVAVVVGAAAICVCDIGEG